MASKVSSAVGAALQFLPQEQSTYQKQLQGVPLQWNVNAQRNYATDSLVGALHNLGVSLDAEYSSKQKRMIEVAEAVAPTSYKKLTDTEKANLNAREMLASTGNFDLIDNQYAIAKIDSIRGEELNKQIALQYLDKMRSEPIKGTLAEQMGDFEDFHKKQLDKHLANEQVTNTFAFNTGLSNSKFQTNFDISSQWYSDKDNVMHTERINATQAVIGSEIRNFFVKTPEEKELSIGKALDLIKTTQNGNHEETAKLVHELMKQATLNGATPEDLDLYMSLPWTPDPLNPGVERTLGQAFDLNGYKDIANVKNYELRTERIVNTQKELDKITTIEGLEKAFDDMKATPELYRAMLPEYNSRKSVIKAEMERRKREQIRLSKQREKGMRTAQALNGFVEAIISGYQSTKGGLKVPQSDSDLKAMDMDRDTYLQGMQSAISTRIATGNYEGLDKLVTNSYIGGDVRRWLSDNLATDLQNVDEGNIPPSVRHALHIANYKESLVDQLFDSSEAGRVKALNYLMNNAGEEEGLRYYTEAKARLNDKAYMQEVKKKLTEVKITGSIPIENIYSKGTTSVYITEDNNYAIAHQMKTMAEVLYSTGRFHSPQEAVNFAHKKVLQNYVGFKNTLVPKAILDKISDNRMDAGIGMEHILRKYEMEIGRGIPTTIEYDNTNGENCFIVKVLGSTHGRVIPADALASEAYGYLEGLDKLPSTREAEGETVVKTGDNTKQRYGYGLHGVV